MPEAQLADVIGASLSGIRFGRQRVDTWRVESAEVTDCTFDHVTVRAALLALPSGTSSVIRDCAFVDCRLGGSGSRGVGSLGAVRFERCEFTGGSIHGWMGHGADFVDCTFAGRLGEVTFFGRIDDPDERRQFGKTRNLVAGNDFRRAELRGVGFRCGVDLGAQRFDPSRHVVLQQPEAQLPRVLEQLGDLPEEQRSRAGAKVEVLLDQVAEGQSQVLFDRDELSGTVPQLWRVVQSVV
jgi:hypothetical protein